MSKDSCYPEKAKTNSDNYDQLPNMCSPPAAMIHCHLSFTISFIRSKNSFNKLQKLLVNIVHPLPLLCLPMQLLVPVYHCYGNTQQNFTIKSKHFCCYKHINFMDKMFNYCVPKSLDGFVIILFTSPFSGQQNTTKT